MDNYEKSESILDKYSKGKLLVQENVQKKILKVLDIKLTLEVKVILYLFIQ